MLLGAAGCTVPAHGAVLSTSLSSASVTAGQQFTLDVNISGLAAGQAIGAFDLDLIFHAGRLAPGTVTFSDRLGVVDVDQFTSVLASPGRIDFAAVSLLDEASLLSLQSDSFRLAQFVFEALAPGAAGIAFDPLADFGLLLSDQFGNAIPISAIAGSTVNVNPSGAVPEPASLLLFAAAALLAGRRLNAGASRA